MSKLRIKGLKKLSDESISQSKYILSAALIEVLRDRNPNDVKALKEVIFWVLEKSEDAFEVMKYSIVDGRILDAADEMVLLAKRSQNSASLAEGLRGELFFKAGILYRPFVTFKALTCFENALQANIDAKLCHAEIGRVYRRLGDITRAVKHEMLSMGASAQSVKLAGVSVSNDKPNQPYASNVTLLPITLVRDNEKKFSTNLELK